MNILVHDRISCYSPYETVPPGMRIGENSKGTSSTSGSSVGERYQVGFGRESAGGCSHAVKYPRCSGLKFRAPTLAAASNLAACVGRLRLFGLFLLIACGETFLLVVCNKVRLNMGGGILGLTVPGFYAGPFGGDLSWNRRV